MVEKLDTKWWTEQKRENLQMLLVGTYTQEKRATKLGVTTRTLRRWEGTMEFMTELERELKQNSLRTKLKRLHATSVIADYFQAKAVKAITSEVQTNRDLKEGEKEVDHSEETHKYFKYFRDARKEERTDFGDTEQRVNHVVTTEATATELLGKPAVSALGELFGDAHIADVEVKMTIRGGEGVSGEAGEVIDVDARDVSPAHSEDVLKMLHSGLNNPELLAAFHPDHGAEEV